VPTRGISELPPTRHLGTLGLEEDLDVSMFGTFDYDAPPGPFDFFSATRRLQDSSSKLIEFVVHPVRLARAVGSPLRSEIRALALVFGSAGVDPRCTTTAELGLSDIYASHKVGGMPFVDQLEGDVGAALHLLDEGFVHLLQLSSLGNLDNVVPGNWFFGETTFHVFARKDRDAFDFRYIWG
jgi:hypothetical protein